MPLSGHHRIIKIELIHFILFLLSIMTIAYHLLTRQEDYKDLGADYFEKRHQDAVVRQTVRKLENLGFTVTLATPEAS